MLLLVAGLRLEPLGRLPMPYRRPPAHLRLQVPDSPLERLGGFFGGCAAPRPGEHVSRHGILRFDRRELFIFGPLDSRDVFCPKGSPRDFPFQFSRDGNISLFVECCPLPEVFSFLWHKPLGNCQFFRREGVSCASVIEFLPIFLDFSAGFERQSSQYLVSCPGVIAHVRWQLWIGGTFTTPEWCGDKIGCFPLGHPVHSPTIGQSAPITTRETALADAFGEKRGPLLLIGKRICLALATGIFQPNLSIRCNRDLSGNLPLGLDIPEPLTNVGRPRG